MRYPLLDGLRGFFLLFMVVMHVNRVTDVTIGKLNHHYFGWVEDAQGFIFISGLVVGLVYGGIYIRKAEADMRREIFRRIKTIYSYHAALVALFFIVAISSFNILSEPPILERYYQDPFVSVISYLFLLDASLDMGILPMYIWFMVFTPFFLRMFMSGQIALVVVLCSSLWFIAQAGVPSVAASGIEDWAATIGVNLDIGFFFNIFAWQSIYFLGLYFGFRLASGNLHLEFLLQRQYLFAFFLGVFVFVLFGLWDRAIFDFWISREFSQWFLEDNKRQVLSDIYVLNFALDLFLLTWLLVAGPTCGIRFLEKLAVFVTWVLKRNFLVFLGQHSLQVFAFHLVLVYAMVIFSQGREFGEIVGSIILIGAAMSLYIPAWVHAFLQKNGKQKKPLPSEAPR